VLGVYLIRTPVYLATKFRLSPIAEQSILFWASWLPTQAKRAYHDTVGPSLKLKALAFCCWRYESLANDVCVLSAGEAGRLEHWGIWPQCKAHKHIKKREALAGAEAGLYRYLGGPDTEIKSPVSMVTAVSVSMWQPVPTAGLIGFRTWGLARTR
jgi:hypothetical protein